MTDDIKKKIFAYLLNDLLEHSEDIETRYRFFGERSENTEDNTISVLHNFCK